MRRGTTPVHTFKPKSKATGEALDLRSAAVVYLTYKQDGQIKVEKTKDEMEITEDSVRVKLSQQDTLSFSTIGDVEIQFRVRYPDGSAPASKVLKIPVAKILKEGII